MHPLNRTITATLFAVHAMLGCCAHQACAVGGTQCSVAGFAHGSHDDPAHQHGSRKPADNSQPLGGHCHHDDCNFMKAQSVRIDASGGQVLCTITAHPVLDEQCKTVCQGIADASIPMPSPAAPRYVQFCALLI